MILCFQYIVTMDEDDAFRETINDFDINDLILPFRSPHASSRSPN